MAKAQKEAQDLYQVIFFISKIDLISYVEAIAYIGEGLARCKPPMDPWIEPWRGSVGEVPNFFSYFNVL